jgi:hypothetical protein
MPHFECGAFDHSATSPGAILGRIRNPLVGASSRRGWRGRQGAAGEKFAGARPRAGSIEVGPPDAIKTGGPVSRH